TGLAEHMLQMVSALDQARANLACIAAGVDAVDLWQRIGPTIPRIGNVLLHLAGTEHHWIGHQVGGLPLKRDREFEFACTGGLDLPTLWDGLNDVRQQTQAVITDFIKSGRTMTPREAFCFHYTIQHLAYHSGQLVTLRKFFRPEYKVYSA
ncbi:MAG: DUF664 domain-containing protein, partial [Phycisphaerae bacterium]